MNKPTGGAAFPVAMRKPASESDPRRIDPDPGMTLRDYFAGQALAGMLACVVPFVGERNAPDGTECNMRAEIAYAHADAMIAEREK